MGDLLPRETADLLAARLFHYLAGASRDSIVDRLPTGAEEEEGNKEIAEKKRERGKKEAYRLLIVERGLDYYK